MLYLHPKRLSEVKRLVGPYRILRNFCVLVLGSITLFSTRAFHPGSSSNRPFACTFTANPRPTSGELILDGKVEASLTQATPNSGNSWTVSDPIQSITVEEGGNYTCVAKMGSLSIVSYAQLGSELDQMTHESFFNFFFLVTCVISVPPQATLLEAGKTKTLTCSGTGYPIPSITWKKTLGSQVKQLAGKESTTDSKRERTSSVTLIGDDIYQAGLYECTVMNTVPGNIKTTKTSLVSVEGICLQFLLERNKDFVFSQTDDCHKIICSNRNMGAIRNADLSCYRLSFANDHLDISRTACD